MPRQKKVPRRSVAKEHLQNSSSNRCIPKANIISYDTTTDESSSDVELQQVPFNLLRKICTMQTAKEIEAQKENILETSRPSLGTKSPKSTTNDSSVELFRVSDIASPQQQTPPRSFYVLQSCSPLPKSPRCATSTPKSVGAASSLSVPKIPCDISFSEQSSENEQVTEDVSSIIDNLSSLIVKSPSRKESENSGRGGLLANTEPSDILKDVTAYVEVRSGTEDISVGLVALLEKLGATVLKHMGRSVTHVVFRQGRVSTRRKALDWNVPMVSPLWVENCRLEHKKVPEADYPAKIPPAYDCPVLSKKIRKPKSWRTTKPLVPTGEILNKSWTPHKERSTKGPRSPKVPPLKVSHPVDTKPNYTPPAPKLLFSPAKPTDLSTAVNDNAARPSQPRTPQHRRSLRTELLKLHAETFKKRTVECGVIAEQSAEGIAATEQKGVDEEDTGAKVERQPLKPSRQRRQLFSQQRQDEAAESFIIARTPPAMSPVASFLDEGDEELVPLGERLQAEKAAHNEGTECDSTGQEDDSIRRYIRRYRITHDDSLDADESNVEELEKNATSHPARKKKCTKKNSSEAKNQRKRKRSPSEDKATVETANGGEADGARRPSLDDFKPNVPPKKKPKSLSWLDSSFEDSTSLGNAAASIVLTSLKPSEEETIFGIVKGLGGFKVEEEVSLRTTHLICGEKKRTLNMLFALAQGCWVLSPKWAYASVEAGKWVSEEEYELSDYFPAVKVGRMDKHLSASGKSSLLGGVGLIYVSPSSVPPCNKLRLLVERAGGKVAQSYLRCDVAVGPLPPAKKCGTVLHVTEKWVLDSISEHRTLPLEDYTSTTPSH